MPFQFKALEVWSVHLPDIEFYSHHCRVRVTETVFICIDILYTTILAVSIFIIITIAALAYVVIRKVLISLLSAFSTI